jgi:ribosomal protein L24E
MGRRMFRTLMVGLCLLAFAAVNASAATSRSAVGTWKLDVSKSSYGNMPAPKFEKLVVMTDKPDAVKWTLTGASGEGKTYVSMYGGPIDGKDRPFGNSAVGNNIAYSRTASGVEWTVKSKSGAVIETGSSQLSADGNTLTLKGTTQGSNGKANFVSVFERVQ